MDNIIWKWVVGMEGLYQVSNFGNVRNFKTKRILKPETTWRGYHRITMGKSNRKMLHRIVCESFLENPYNLPIINHIDGIKIHNTPDNLEWCTQSYNSLHSLNVLHNIPANTGYTGSKSKLSKPCAKIKNNKIIELYSGASDADRITGISRSSIIQVCNSKRISAGGFNWMWLQG